MDNERQSIGQDPGQLTRISGNNMRFLVGKDRTPEQIVEFIKDGAVFREFPDVLRKVYSGDDLTDRLVSGLVDITGEARDSVAKKVRNWINGKSAPQNRETLFQISFILGLSEEETSWLLGAAAETGIHYRNGQELVWAYGLRKAMSYKEARQLMDRLRQDGLLPDREKKDKKKKAGLTQERPRLYTRQVRQAFDQVETEEDLGRFLQEYQEELGQLHETAYRKFSQLLDILQKPEGPEGQIQEERQYTMSDVVQEYLSMNVPEGRKTSGMSVLQRMIKKYWPSETSLSNMKNRGEDVTRKVLMLLYLTTEAVDEAGEDEADYYFEDLEEDPDILLETRIEKMNLFLDTCGMNLLDPGNPFDYLAIYAMRTEDVGSQMAQVLDVVFEGRGRRQNSETDLDG